MLKKEAGKKLLEEVAASNAEQSARLPHMPEEEPSQTAVPHRLYGSIGHLRITVELKKQEKTKDVDEERRIAAYLREREVRSRSK